MFGGLEGILALACSALCCLLFVVVLIGLAVMMMRKKGGDDEPSSATPSPGPALNDEGADPVTDMAEGAATPEPAPAEPPPVKASPRKAAPPMPPRDAVPSSRSVNLDEPLQGGLAAGPSATIIPPDDWIDDNEDDATLLMPKKPPE